MKSNYTFFMRFSQSQIAIGIICGVLIAGRLFINLTRADLPPLEHTYTFENCPVSIEMPTAVSLDENDFLEKITSSAENYLYRASCIPLIVENPNQNQLSLMPSDLLEMFNLDEIEEITDTNFELSGLANGPLFYFEYLGNHEKRPIKSLGAIYFKPGYLLNVELITFDQSQDNIDANDFFDSVKVHPELMERPPKIKRRSGTSI